VDAQPLRAEDVGGVVVAHVDDLPGIVAQRLEHHGEQALALACAVGARREHAVEALVRKRPALQELA
jgi:hypothetical protein